MIGHAHCNNSRIILTADANMFLLAEIDYFSRLPDTNRENLRGVTTRARPACLSLFPVKYFHRNWGGKR